MRVLQAAAVALIMLVSASPAHALELKGTEQKSDRLTELTFATDALVEETKVRILTPRGYDPNGTRRYPVLLLLHGAIGSHVDWTDKGAAEATTADFPVIVVMPDGGFVGNYTDWYNDGAFGPPEWERYHITELLPWVDANYKTIGKRGGRAIAGLSMGGAGTMKYAAAYPHLFSAAYGFSAAVDTNHPSVTPVTQAGGLSDGSHTPGAIFGLRPNDEVRWRNENGTDLADNLAPLKLALITRNGDPGGPEGGSSFDPVEYSVHEQSLAMHDRMLELGIPHLWDDQGAGGHTWYYWTRDLAQILPPLMERFAHAPKRPAKITYKRADPDYSVWGWKVHFERPAMEFTTLRDAGRRGFSLSGSGVATVRTPRFYKPGAAVRAVLRSGTGTVNRSVTASRTGRVSLELDLGPGNPSQQYTAGATTRVFTTHVKLAGKRR